jgi:hypothetical protein
MIRTTLANRFEYTGWDVEVEFEEVDPRGRVAGHADLSQDGVRKCRVALVIPLREGASALEVLGEQARAFIDDWHRRHLTGYRDL